MTPDAADAIARNLRARFTWESDGLIDSYHVMPATGQVRGDCDDYAATMLAELTGRSWVRFWWWLVTFKACFWLVTSPRGEAHITLWVRGLGYTDNWRTGFSKVEDLHKRRYPLPWPSVALKLLIGMVDRT